MIYDFPDSTQPIRQGDIFKNVPRVFFDPSKFSKLQQDEESPFVETNWLSELEYESIQAVSSVMPVYGIIFTQDCDTQHRGALALFLVDRCTNIIGPSPNSDKNQVDWWVKKIVTHTRLEERWFYLPSDEKIGFSDKMAVDFRVVIPVEREFLESNLSQLRIGRLNDEADEHFRERIAQYYRRYPYDEWYPLNREEYLWYLRQNRKNDPSAAPPRPWQE